MISNIVKPGDRVELIKISSEEKITEIEKKRTYFSKICDIMEEDKLKILMPTVGMTMMVAVLNAKLELYIYSKGALYQ